MRAGRLRHLLVIEESSTSQDEMGHPVRQWREHASAWGSIEPAKADRRKVADQILTETPVTIVVRYMATLASFSERRIRWHDASSSTTRYYRIDGIREENYRRDRMTIDATETREEHFS